MIVVVVIETGCGVVAAVAWAAVVVVVVAWAAWVAWVAWAAWAARIQHRTPRLRPRAPSTPAELVMPGLVMN